jgi:hypothetical protein
MSGTSKTSLHRDARDAKADVTACELAPLGHCLGELQVAHLDGDETNSADENLAKLCRSHHALWDRRRITRHALRQPAYWTDASGKRRYLHPSPAQSAIAFPDQP